MPPIQTFWKYFYEGLLTTEDGVLQKAFLSPLRSSENIFELRVPPSFKGDGQRSHFWTVAPNPPPKTFQIAPIVYIYFENIVQLFINFQLRAF